VGDSTSHNRMGLHGLLQYDIYWYVMCTWQLERCYILLATCGSYLVEHTGFISHEFAYSRHDVASGLVYNRFDTTRKRATVAQCELLSQIKQHR
jgi:hypothetical protein